MKLTLCSSAQTVCIDIQTNQFALLRNPDISAEQIDIIAKECGVSSALLLEYAQDLKKSTIDTLEIDGSCDYSDQL